MSDYSIKIGTELDTKGIDIGLKKYQGKPIEIKSKLDTSGIDKKLASYKAKKPIEVNTKLNTTGLAKKIGEYKPKTPVKINAKLDTKNIDATIRSYKAKKAIELNVKLNHSEISKQIRSYKANTSIKLNTRLDNKEINSQIRNYQAKTPIKLGVKLTTKDIDEKIRAYKAKTPIKLDVKINKSTINEQIKSFNPRNTIKLKAALQKGIIAEEIRNFKPSTPIKVDLDLNYSDIETKVKTFASNPIELPVKLKPATKDFSSGITKTPVRVNAELNPESIKTIGSQLASLQPETPIVVRAQLDDKAIDSAISEYQTKIPTIRVNVKVNDNDIDKETRKQNAQSPIQVNVKLDRKSINEQIRTFTTKTKVNVGVKLDSKGIAEQIRKIEPKTKIKVSVRIDPNDVAQQIGSVNTNTPVRLNVELDPNGIQNVNNQINALRQQIQNLGNVTINLGGNGNGGRGVGNAASAYQRALRGVHNLYKQIESMELKLGKLDMSGIDSGNIANYRNQLDQLRQTYVNLLATLSGQNGAINLDLVFTDIDQARTSITELSSTVDNARTKLARDIKIDIDNGNLGAQIDSVVSNFRQLGVESQTVENEIRQLQALLSNMDASDDVESVTADYQTFLHLLETVTNRISVMQSMSNNMHDIDTLDLKKQEAMSKLTSMFEDGSQAAKVFGTRAKQLAQELNACGAADFSNVNRKISILGQEVKKSNLQVKTFGTRLKEQFSKYTQYLSIASVFMYATQAARSMFEQVKAIDSAMTELKKVTDETEESYNQFLSNAATRSKELGTTLEGLVSSTADFARLGYGFKESQGLAEVANIYAVVGDEIEGVEGATKSLISTLAAFKDEASGISDTDFAMDIVDKFNEVSNNFAISSGGIGEAMERSASSMRAANNTIDETIALITAANTVVQDPTAIGTSFKTLSMRIRGAKTEMEEAGLETDGMVESTAKLREEILALSGVDIMEDNNTFKSTYKILDELSVKWKELSDIQQATITELIAGKRQGNVVSSLMQNFDIARSALDTSLNSSGSAMKEHEKWSKSLEARLNKLKAAWQGLSQAFMKSDFLKSALDGVIKLVDGLTKLIDTFGAFPVLLGVFAGFKIIPNLFGKISATAKSVGGGIKSLSDVLALLQLSFPRVTALIGKFITALKKSDDGSRGFTKSLKGIFDALKQHWIIAIVVAAVTVLTTVFGYQAKQAEKLAEKVEELTDKYREQHEELKKLESDYDTSNESSMISKYEKLSKGVDNLGRNVSLTAEEYSEYQDIVNKIAEQFPSLVSGYDEQGNALLTVKGNVEALTEAYEKLIHAQNQDILTKTGDIEKDFANTLKKSGGEHWWSNGHGFWAGLFENGADVVSRISGLAPVDFVNQFASRMLDYELKTDTARSIQNLLNATSDSEKEKILNELKLDRFADEELRDLLPSAGFDVGFFENPVDALEKALEKDPAKLQEVVNNYYAQFAEVVEEQKTIAQAKLSEAFDVSSVISGLDYGNISEDLQAIAYQTINSLDYDFFTKLSESGKTVEQWTTEMLNQINSISKADNTQIEAAFDLQTQFNGGEISYGEYVRNLKDVQSTIDGLNLKGEAKEQLEISLGLNENGIIDQYDALVKRLTDTKNYDFDISENEAKKLLDGLSSEELAIAVDVITEMSNNNVDETIDQVRAAIDRELAIRGLTLELSIDVEKTKLEALTTAITESFSGSGLSSEPLSAVEGMFKTLSSYDSSKLFERTANGIRLNSDEFRRLSSEYKKTNVVKLNEQMDSLGDIYNQTREELYRLTYGTDEYNAKAAELSNIEAQIKATEQLAAQYEGLASAYQEWQMVESAGSQRDMYESLIEGLENIDDEISRGWYDDGTIEYLELLTGKDLSTAGIEEVKKAYKGLGKEIEHTSYSVRDFFTVDDEGNSTNAGVYNFLDAIGQLEEEAFGGKDVVKRNKSGKIIGFDFQIVGGDKVIADALGISEELVQIMVRAADDAGFVVSMDGTYQQLDVLKEKAQEASVSLNDILEKNGKKGFDFNFNSSNVDDIKNQLTEAQKILDTFRNTDGTINTKLEGADEALTVASTLQSMLDKLTRPTYMDIEVSQVEDEIQEPLRNLQELRRLTETEHQLKLSGADTSKLEESKQEVYEYFEGLDAEVKATLGLVDEKGNPLTGDALKDKLNSGDIAIEATVDIQMEMDEKLGVLVDKALLDAGIIDDEEFEKRVKVYLNADVDNDDAKNKTEQAVNEVAGNNNDGNSTSGQSLDDKVDKNIDVEVKADKVDTSDVKNKTEDAIKSEVESIKSEVEAIKSEIATAKSDVESLATSLNTLQGISEEISVSVDANLNGNVPHMDESGQIDNLLMFAAGAKELQDLDVGENGVVSLSVEANLRGNVPNLDEESQIDDLLMFAAGAKELQDLDDVDVDVDVSISKNTKDILKKNENTFTQDLQTLAKGISDLQGLDGVDIDIDVSLSEDTKSILAKNENAFTQDLQTLANGVSDLQGLDNVDIDIDVSLSKDTKSILSKNEDAFTQDLQTLAEGISDLQNLKDEDVDIDIDISLSKDTKSILNKNENAFTQDLQTLAKGISDLRDLDSVDVDVDVSLSKDTKSILNKNEDAFTQDLQTLADGLSKLQDVKDGDVDISVDVSLSEDTKSILNKNEDAFTQDLQTLADGVSKLQDLDDVDVDVNVSISKDTKSILNKNENAFTQDLQTLAKGISDLQGLSSVDVDVDISISEDTKNVLSKNENAFTQDLQTLAKGISDLQGLQDVNANVDVSLSENTKSILDKNENAFTQDLQTLAKGISDLQGLSSVDIGVNVSADGNAIIGDDSFDILNRLQNFASVANNITNQDIKVSVTANVDSENVNKAIQLLRDVSGSGVFKDYKATVQVGATIATIDDTTVQNYKAPEKDGEVSYSVSENSPVYTWTAPSKDGVVNYSAEVEALTSAQKNKTGTITYKANIVGLSPAAGTAYAGGSTGRAFARGDWGIKGNGVALGGEMGRELIVRDGKFFTVGDEGAEFFRYKKNDIVFNATQTESLFKYGGIKGANPRGKMLASGTAFAEGVAFGGSSGSGGSGKVSGNSVTGQSYGSKGSSSDKNFEEVIDWIEVIIDRVERAIDKFDQQANNIYKSWSSRNAALQNQISEVSKEIGLQQKAYNKYMSAANGVGLSSSWAAKVRNGEIDIDTIKDETLADKIKSYQDYYEKALDCQDAIRELREEESKLYAQRFENIQTQYDGILQGYEHTEAMLNEYISQAEEQGYIVSKKYYQALVDNEKSNIAELKKEQADLIAERDNAVAEGKITKGSEAWLEQCKAIDEVTQSIESGQTALLEYARAMEEIDWSIFDLIQERISDITAESEFLIELMSNKDLFDDNGKFTEQGVATVGLHALNYNTAMYAADDYQNEINKLDKQIAKDPYDQELINRRRELVELQRESILEAENQKNAIKDLVEEGINLELDALQERIDLHNEELDSMKDFYDYQKDVEKQTKNIASLRKQLGAYEGFDDEETRAKVQELKVSLEEAEADLFETEYDKLISDTSALLDTLYTEYETILNSRLDNIDFLLEQVIDGINAAAGSEGTITSALGADGAIAAALGSNATTIGETLKTEVGNVGTKLSTAMSNIWLGDGSGKAVLDLYGKDFQNRATTANDALNNIKANVNAMVDDVDKDAQKKVEANKTATSAKKNPTTTTTTNTNKNTTTTNKTSSNNSKITDDVLMGIASAIWVYGSGSGWGNNPFRENKLKNKIGEANAKKVQSNINSYGSSGKLYDFWIKKGKNLDKYKYSAFKSGAKEIDATQLAWTQENGQEFIVRPSDGAILTPVAKGDSVLNAAASSNIWQMANSPAEFIKDNLGIGSANVPNAQNVNNNITQNFENITFSMPNIHGYNDLLREMQSDPKFEKLVLSMTVDRIAGRSSLAKGKSIR